MAPLIVEGDLTRPLAHKLRSEGRIAVDTETTGLDWSTDRLQLCQLFTEGTGPILLRSVRVAAEHLGSVLSDREVVKVFHFAPFDLRFIEGSLRLRVENVACTKAASKLLDPMLPTGEHSLAALVSRHLGVTIKKGAVRTSDWGALALSVDQVEYAAADVAHLLELHAVLLGRLQRRGLVDLYDQVRAYMPVDSHLEVSGVPNPLEY